MLCSASPALAELFVNGGFETGDFTGWTLDYGYYNGGGSISWGQGDHGLRAVIDDSGTMPGQTLDIDPYNGNYMARINDIYGGNHATKISQQGAISQDDIDSGTLYVNWGAALVNPSGHPDDAQPLFGINVSVDGVLQSTFQANGNEAATTWTLAGSDGYEPLYYKQDTWTYDLSAYDIGDSVLVEMFVADCSWGGHGGYAFLDGIGTAYQPPGQDPVVPVPAAAILGWLGVNVAGWLSHRRGELLA